MTTYADFRNRGPQCHPDLDLARTRAALQPLLDKLARWEELHGSELSDTSVMTTTVGVVRGIRAALDQPASGPSFPEYQP